MFDVPDIIQAARLEVDKDCPWYVASVPTLVVVDIDPLQLEVGRSLVLTVGVDSVLLRDNLPELCSYLIATLTHLANENILDTILRRMLATNLENVKIGKTWRLTISLITGPACGSDWQL